MRGLAAGFLKAKVGNGQRLSFWYDRWTPLGPLITRFGELGPRELQIDEYALVKDACNSEGWLLRGARSQAAEELHLHLTTIPLPSLSATDDSYVWEVGGNELQEFSTSKTWSQVRNRATEQRWTQNIWFKGHTPRHAFTTWVAHQDRLPTRTRLVAWGMQIPSLCCLCSLVDESRDHLFLRCEVSGTVWGYVLRRLGYFHRGFHTWVAFTDWMRLRDTVVSVTLKRVAAQATIASIWTERNKRLHDGVSQTPASLFKKIDRNVRDTILGKRKTALFQHLMQEWLRHE
ncbi:uncharacterized protein LOC106349608 [Brassica napus]|uniref:uncharacterized protein LOC106349608 n=1 Tax=Brassica napus TaxID=3708 RepID=UPI0006AB4893|nr:uncharacterized protein LOC106349608 [Brassica napus]